MAKPGLNRCSVWLLSLHERKTSSANWLVFELFIFFFIGA